VQVKRIRIDEFLNASKEQLVLDVRSPSEYVHAHIPSAINLPLFSDEERKQVGTTYKQVSREAAIKIGLDIFGPKMRSMVEAVELMIKKSTPNAYGNEPPLENDLKPIVFIYCWRGGMRSAAVAWLLDLYGYRVQVLAGGYKSFRNYVLKTFTLPFNLKIIGGYTGSGKTLVLKALQKRGETIIDLEAIASHKGSAFGNIQMIPQPSQEMFENLLALELIEKCSDCPIELDPLAYSQTTGKMIWLEDESQRIGDLNLPNVFWNTMRAAPLCFLEIGFEQRLENICEEYGALETEKLIHSTQRICKRLGPMDTKNTIEFLEQGNTKEAFRILLKYYDKHYLKGLNNRSQLEKLLSILPCVSVTPANADLLKTQYQML
jgi:tRNA 2-selenouridine synthase